MLAKLSTRCAALRRGALLGTAVLVLLTGGLPAAAGDAKDASRPDLSRFYEQRVSWSRCKGDGMPKDLECGKVTVPLDYARPGGATLDLAVARYRAAGHRTGSVVLNFGGPGGPGVAQLAASGKEFMGLTDNYDVVSFDPRGVGRSSPVSCGDRDDVLAIEGSATVDDPAKVLGQLRRAAAACEKHSGPVLRHIGTVDAAKDLDVIRQALGDRKLTYLGFSYGTRLGAVYAALFPGKVGRMALDGVDTLTEPLTEQALVGGARSAGGAGRLRGLVCAGHRVPVRAGRPYGPAGRGGPGAVPGPRSPADRVRAAVHRSGPGGRDGAGAVQQGVVAVAGACPGRAGAGRRRVRHRRLLPRRLRPAAADAGGGGLVDPQEVPLDNLPAALMAINCADDPDRPDAARLTRELGRMRAAFEHASPVFGQFRMTEVLLCYGRPKGDRFHP
ncbi:hypothetical protein GCM10020256_71470 [Streptomyces thermocoprophilus]